MQEPSPSSDHPSESDKPSLGERLLVLSENLIPTRWSALTDDLRERFHEFQDENRRNVPLLTRLTAHLGIIALVIIGLLLSGIEIRAATAPASYDQNADNSGLPSPQTVGVNGGDTGLTVRVNPLTVEIKQKPVRREVVQYSVKPGDNVSAIASGFGLNPDSILWANAKLEDNPDLLSVGQVLNIPPINGVLYTVAKGDSLPVIAARFKAQITDILADPFNQANHDFKASPPLLVAGEFLMVPGGEKPYVARKVTYSSNTPAGAAKGTSNFMWPVGGCVSQNFWARHAGIDVASSMGVSVVAADSGYVQVVGWDNSGYGNMILINHGNGYVTRYAHLSAFAVQAGQSVKRGQLIGRVGSTGRSTGPHLHFEVINGGVPRNPAYFVSGRAPAQCRR